MTLLVVDDDASIRQLVKRLLTSTFDVQVIEADDGTTALRALLNSPVPVDVVLLDLQMRNLGGIDTLRAIRRSPLFGRVPVFLFTGRADEEDVHQAIKSGISGAIIKPFALEELCRRLDGVLRRRPQARRAM